MITINNKPMKTAEEAEKQLEKAEQFLAKEMNHGNRLVAIVMVKFAEQYCEEKMKEKIIELLGIEITDADKGEFTINTAALADIILTNKE
jgi:ribosome-binding factor A